MPKGLLAAVLVTGLFYASGCASVVSKTDSTTYLETDPEKARCVLHGQDFKRIVNTPDSIQLPSAAAPLTVACEAEGYKNTTAILDTKTDGWIWGNILLGGVIGAVVDGARGAGFKYPPKFTVLLEPEEFPTLAARDSWFDGQVAIAKTKWEQAIKKVRSNCDREEKSACDDSVAKVEKQRDEELAALEGRRAAAKVAGMSAEARSQK